MGVAERVSIIATARPYIPLAAPPDGEISAGDRATLGHGYMGILAAQPLPFLSPRWAMVVARRAAVHVARRAAILVTVPPAPEPILT